tara:strand:- start:2947 stop:3267 length:321 start_codon:yes stop_codon:yes gene_type:complete
MMLPSYHHSTPQPKWIIPESKTSDFQERGEFFEDIEGIESPNREQENPFDINVAGRIINGLYSKHLRFSSAIFVGVFGFYAGGPNGIMQESHAINRGFSCHDYAIP